ncbi:MAG: bifunctional hydroxymethylpyrimidine kinase/phosphomethylpyrimidine kinase, partial [Clostridia bacterium]|nr:bifunctional hydroxymethylpyrimidine kinase/phosphomethylpyrimidine kinase [Clostridia bacterium]
AILPSAVLSTHTAGFKGFTFRDLAGDMPKINEHWKSEGIKFEAVYTGYLGSIDQVDYVLDIVKSTLNEGGLFIVDPAMADNGKLYPIFDMDYVKAMVRLCEKADYLLPNITEACFLTGVEYKEEYDKEYIDILLKKLTEIGAKNIILTGVSYKKETTGVVVYENGKYSYYEHVKLPNSCHGTGDIYASAFVGAMMNGKTAYESAKISADYVVECIKATAKENNHWYGAKFEPLLKDLIKSLE